MSKFGECKSSLAARMMFSQAACVSAPPTTTRTIYKPPGTVAAQWGRIQDECTYETAKATASASIKTPVEYRQFRLFNMCAKLKGAAFVGTVTMRDKDWQRLSKHCKAEAKSAFAGRPASHSRDEAQEDFEFECYKKNGVVFRETFYP